MMRQIAILCCLIAWSSALGCETTDFTEISCKDRISVALEAENGDIPTGTYTFTMAPGSGPTVAAICSLPNSNLLDDCNAQGEQLTLNATMADNRIIIELLAPIGELGDTETYDISVSLNGKVLIAETIVPRFENNEVVSAACDVPTCNEADDVLALP